MAKKPLADYTASEAFGALLVWFGLVGWILTGALLVVALVALVVGLVT